MSLKLGTQDIAGISQNKICNAHFLLEAIWSDHIINDISFLRADTFSWQSGDVYTSVYNHLVQDLQGTTAETETIGSYTVTFYRATDGHKVCLADQEQTVLNIYNSYGIAWYYILDTTNIQFKLPRTKYGFEGLRTNVGDKIDESLPNITGDLKTYVDLGRSEGTGAIRRVNDGTKYVGTNLATSGTQYAGFDFDASRVSSAYQDNAPVQERATQMYLYLYVGDYSQTAIEQTAGLNSELFNGKADTDLSNCTKPHIVETYVNGASWYRVYSDGWCEQGGFLSSNSNWRTCTFLKPFVNTNYNIYVSGSGTQNGQGNAPCYVNNSNKTISSFQYTSVSVVNKVYWRACGYIY